MGVVKNAVPILEYDREPKAVLMPNRDGSTTLPKRAVYAFIGEEVERYAKAHSCQKIGEFETITRKFPIYQVTVQGEDICVCAGHLGGAGAALMLDYLYSCGVEAVIATGTCGALEDFPENEFLIPTEALRDEGASYHYLPPARTVSISQVVRKSMEDSIRRMGRNYQEVKTWTTDGFFRETADMVAYRKEEGFAVVDMECASMAACAEFRNKIFGQILFTADTLANPEDYQERGFGIDAHEEALMISLTVASELKLK